MPWFAFDIKNKQTNKKQKQNKKKKKLLMQL